MGNSSQAPAGASTNRENRFMEIVAYWQQHCAPYLRAKFGRDERGASLVEYALLVALIAVICIVAIAFLGKAASSKFSTVGSSVGS
jgi:pilus assembly protein Flp/PilA